jgi:hypothetical protein
MEWMEETRGMCGGARMPVVAISLSSHLNYTCNETYEWKSAVSTGADLWLVEVDEDLWMAQWSTAAVALNVTLVNPADWLLVDEIDGRLWCRLYSSQHLPSHFYSALSPPLSTKLARMTFQLDL